MARIRAVLCAPDSPCRVWRNNVGSTPDAKDPTGKRWIQYGLGVGSADLIGLVVGTGQFIGCEIKRPGEYQSPEQRAWQKTIQSFGGIAVVLKSVEEAEALLGSIKDGTINARS